MKPQEAGRHALTIKYAGEHVPGSPFTLRVSGAPDASKVCYLLIIYEIYFTTDIICITKETNIFLFCRFEYMGQESNMVY